MRLCRHPGTRIEAGQPALPHGRQHDHCVAGHAVRENLPYRLRQHGPGHDFYDRRDGRDRRERVRWGRRRRCAGGSGGAGGTSGSSTVVRTTSKNDFWEVLRDNIRGILNSTRLQSLTADAKAERLALVKQDQELRVKQMEAASRAAGRAEPATSVMTGPAGPAQSRLLPDDVVVNAVSGTITMNATERQHQLVQQHIDSIVNVMQRQVLIEATIVEVSSRTTTRPGSTGRGSQRAAASRSTSSCSAAALGVPRRSSRWATTEQLSSGRHLVHVRLLEQFGNTRVLSSPKLMALNNQTALLKVVDNIVYFKVKAQTQPGANAFAHDLQHDRQDGPGGRRHERDAADRRDGRVTAHRAPDDFARDRAL